MAKINTRKRGTKWEYRFESATIEDKRKQITKGGFRTKKEALEEGAKALNEYNQCGSKFTSSNISVSDYMDLWFEQYCVINLKYNTQLNYRGLIENHIKPKLGIYKLNALTPSVVQTFVNNLKLKGYSKSHTIGIKATLSGALDYAIEPLQLIKFNPCANVVNPKFITNKINRYIISYNDFKKILERFPEGKSFYLQLLIGYHTGLRLSEAFALTWDDIDFENKTISVNKIIHKRYKNESKQTNHTGWYLGSTKNKQSVRTIFIDNFLLNELKKERKRQMENKLYYGEHYTNIYLEETFDEKNNPLKKIVEIKSNKIEGLQKTNFIAVRENGELLSTDSFKYCSKVIKKMGINFNYHSLRHTHATILIENGANIKDVQSRLGHSNIKTTLNIYTHATEKMSKQTIDIFERALK